MPSVFTIERSDVIDLIEEAASRLTSGDKTEAVALGMRRLLSDAPRQGPLFGAHAVSVGVSEGVDLTAPTFGDALDGETGAEFAR
jgi:hypothetical protein